MNLNAYLHFNDNCREAFEFYRSVFGGEFAIITTFADGPADMPPLPENEKDRIMHVSLPIGSATLMGSDTCTPFGPPPVAGNNFSISISADTREETDRAFALLAEGGNVAMPPQDMFWGAYFGMCTDKFGVNWMLSCETHVG
ncbi:MAG: VOC family protein [Dehalococcoidia bacterium]|nr:VOC family protein [Dehalococcoidia bacterium]